MRAAGPAVLLLAVTLGPESRAALPANARRCEAAAAKALRTCLRAVTERTRDCHFASGSACADTDAKIAGTVEKVGRTLRSRCRDDATVAAVGWGPLLGVDSLAARVREACLGADASLAARSFGGPHGAALAVADAPARRCLATAHANGARLVERTVKEHAACLRRARRDRPCDVEKVARTLRRLDIELGVAIDAACPDLATPIGLYRGEFMARASAQGRCLTATVHGGAGPLDLDCGPRAAVPLPPRGAWTRIVLPESEWGTRCGDGSSYAFWLQLAPEGAPLDRVAIDLAGGGVCVFESDCIGVSSSLFRATDDAQPTGGYMSTSASVNPLWDWTKIYLPYCTQDIHFGNGTTSDFPSITVHRFGGVNVRTTLGYLRDVLWAALDATSPDGYRPDALRVLFAGESAGAFGVAYNYHWVVDDLGWPRTTGAPDSGLGLDNGQLVGLRGLGLLAQSPVSPLGWDTRPLQPPYCLAGSCLVVPELEAATAPRLRAVPEQQILNLSNQVDATQVGTTFFPDMATWTNAARASYCRNRGLNGIHFFLPASSSSIHTFLRSNTRYNNLRAGGVSAAEYLTTAFADPDSIVDRVDEGALVTAIPGVLPIEPCPAASPSGAFVA